MSKKRGNKKGKNLDDDFEETPSITNAKDDLTSKSTKNKPAKKGKKGKKDDDWSDEESNTVKGNYKYIINGSNSDFVKLVAIF